MEENGYLKRSEKTSSILSISSSPAMALDTSSTCRRNKEYIPKTAGAANAGGVGAAVGGFLRRVVVVLVRAILILAWVQYCCKDTTSKPKATI
jgi:hypothetical protein